MNIISKLAAAFAVTVACGGASAQTAPVPATPVASACNAAIKTNGDLLKCLDEHFNTIVAALDPHHPILQELFLDVDKIFEEELACKTLDTLSLSLVQESGRLRNNSDQAVDEAALGNLKAMAMATGDCFDQLAKAADAVAANSTDIDEEALALALKAFRDNAVYSRDAGKALAPKP